MERYQLRHLPPRTLQSWPGQFGGLIPATFFAFGRVVVGGGRRLCRLSQRWFWFCTRDMSQGCCLWWCGYPPLRFPSLQEVMLDWRMPLLSGADARLEQGCAISCLEGPLPCRSHLVGLIHVARPWSCVLIYYLLKISREQSRKKGVGGCCRSRWTVDEGRIAAMRVVLWGWWSE